MIKLLPIFIVTSVFFLACDSSPTHVTSVTTIYGPDDHDCSGMPVRMDKTTACQDLFDCPEDDGCSNSSGGFHQKTEYTCNSSDACDEKNRSPENDEQSPY